MKLDPIALAIPAFLVLIAVELGVARLRGQSVYRFHDAISDLGCGISSRAPELLFKVALAAPYAMIAAFIPYELEGWVAHLVAFLAVDFVYYWWHRWTHEMSIGWATHVVHHQSEDYNLAVALRQSMTSQFSSAPFYMFIALLGVPVEVFLLHNALNTLYQFWIHTELIRKMPGFGLVFNTPSHHRVHHAVNPQYLDRNYAGVLIIWDRMFGSFEPEGEPCTYGTVKPLDSFNPLYANMWHFEALARDAAAAPNLAERAKVFFKGPKFRPSTLPPHPVAALDREKYEVSSPGWLRAYVLVQFVPLVAVLSVTLMSYDLLESWEIGLLALWLAATPTIASGLLESRSWAKPAEAFRLMAAPGMLIHFFG